jgi:hypothetical protein
MRTAFRDWVRKMPTAIGNIVRIMFEHHAPRSLPEDSVFFSSDDDFNDLHVATLGNTADVSRDCDEQSNQRKVQRLHHAHTTATAARGSKPRISLKTASAISLQLTRRSRRARLSILDALLRRRIEDVEVSAVVCAHLHDRSFSLCCLPAPNAASLLLMLPPCSLCCLLAPNAASSLLMLHPRS